MMKRTIHYALEIIDSLNLSDQEILYDLITKRIIESRRKKIKSSYQNTMKAIGSGKAKKGNLEELLKTME